MMKSKILAAIIAAAAASPVLADTYDIDTAHTSIGFGAKHMVVSTVKGSFGEFSGSFDYDAANPTALKGSVTVKVDSITTANKKRDDHLKAADFFDASKFPEIKFEATGADKMGDQIVIKGKLTIKETTKDVSIPVTVNGPIEDPWKNQRVGIEGSFKLNRKDYGLNFDSKLANGGLVVADEITIEIHAEGTKRK